ncbi:hypothetical protein CDV31_004390 [Fusarium ambrosium]|uniref:Uncharacterized protein n=1 Tax=Fusarium ambrosium TaxID=131363 RepID=A0A428UR78_9HYPO|nr:hypothetical protein CDV31_004390 [Fusarium ambrosium]
MASSSTSTTPGDDPSHSTYEVNVPVRNGRGAEPEVSNPEIRIPRIKPVTEEQSKKSPEELAVGLEGKYVDEFGNILDWDGTVLGRVEGDLPSMVGRPVSASGEILDAEGEVAGRVCENYIKPKLEPLSSGLRVDSEGNIYDEEGNVVGKINKLKDKDRDSSSSSNKDNKNDSNQTQQQQQQQQGGNVNVPKPPVVAPRPDELYLDVKSTFDGIQLIIKIPTVFNRDNSQNQNQNQNNNQGENQGQTNNNQNQGQNQNR